MPPDRWLEQTPVQEGSWWPAWIAWLQERSGTPVKPPAIGAPSKGYKPQYATPGNYVLET